MNTPNCGNWTTLFSFLHDSPITRLKHSSLGSLKRLNHPASKHLLLNGPKRSSITWRELTTSCSCTCGAWRSSPSCLECKSFVPLWLYDTSLIWKLTTLFPRDYSRWFRLLFGREFPMEDVLNLWDGIFAKDPSLNIVIFIGLALLLKIRDDCTLIVWNIQVHRNRHETTKLIPDLHLNTYDSAGSGLFRMSAQVDAIPLRKRYPLIYSTGVATSETTQRCRWTGNHPTEQYFGRKAVATNSFRSTIFAKAKDRPLSNLLTAFLAPLQLS